MLYPRFLLLPFLLATIPTAFAEPKPVELVLSSKKIEPATALEVRFAEPMVGREGIGQAANACPLVLQPTIPGKFVWLSTRSGAFSPDEPWPLSTTFSLTLRNDLRNAEGKICRFAFHETFQTPELELKGWHSPRYIDANDAPAAPRITLLFNANIAANATERFVQFVDERGAVIEGRAREPKDGGGRSEQFPAWRSNDGSVLTWAERFHSVAAPQSARGNQLIVTPAVPLTPGSKWKLMLQAGLPAQEEQVRLLQSVEIPLGAVRPFTVEASPSTSRQAGRRLLLSFSKALNNEVTEKNVGRWIRIAPEPSNMQAHLNNSQIEFTGDFDLTTKYRVTIAAGFPSAEPLVLGRAYSREITFKPIEPTLAFEEFSTHQLSAGARRFHLLALNVPRLRITAKLFNAETLPAAVAAYDRAGGGSKVIPENLAGRTIWQREMAGTTTIDAEEEIALAWDDIIGVHKTGAVLLTAEQIEAAQDTARRVGTQALVQLTDLGLVWKTNRDEVFVHVFSLTTQEARQGVRLRALDEKQAVVAEATSDASGIARLSCREPHRLLAIHEGDAHLVDVTNWQSHISAGRLGVRYSGEEDDEEGAEAFIFTDRGVYKPGETAHLKAILPRQGKNRVVAEAKARLRLTDPRDREIINKIVSFSASGSVAEDLVLPKGRVGSYRLVLERIVPDERGEMLGEQTIEVQEYRPNPFEVLLGGSRSAVGAKTFELPLTAKYYMGKPLGKARVTWSLTANDDAFSPEGFEDFAFCNGIRGDRLNRELDRLAQFNDQGEGELDAKGTMTISALVPLNAKAPQPRSARLLCEITDLDQQTVSEAAHLTVHSSDFYLGLRRLPEVIHENEAVPLELVAVGADGTPCAESLEATVRLTRVEWQTNRVETAGESTEYISQPLLELVAHRTVKTRRVTKENNRWILEKETETEPLRVGRAGQYLVEATTRDKEGRDVVTSATLYVSGEDRSAWDYRNEFQVEVVADKETYRAGETATLLVKTPIDGEALVTIERENVLRSFSVPLKGTAPGIAIPIEEGDAPNVFVSVMLLRGAAQSPRKLKAPEYRVGYCELKVERPQAKLNVYVKTAAGKCQPGDEITVDCEVLDFEGRPVADSELALYAVDEGVLSLTGYQTPDPLAFFQKPRALAVRTGLTLPTLLDEDPETREFVNKGYLVGGGGGPGAERIRKNFVACAFWNATLSTDGQGRLSAKFTAPDSLTRYRIIAIAHTQREQFGSGEAAFEVNKPIMIEPALPRFANVGDKLMLRAVLHNMTDLAGEIEVSLTSDETAKASEPRRQVTLAAHGSVAVDFPVEMVKSGNAQWRWDARFSAADTKTVFRDVVQTELKVNFPAPLLRELRLCPVDSGKEQALDGLDPRLLEGNGVARVSITNSRAIELEEALQQLLHYPYGCVEQTTSSTLPWLGLQRVRGALPALHRADSEIAGAIQHGVDRLLSMQTSSGGLSYWPGETEPMLWGSAYGGMGLVLAKRCGADVPAEELDRLLKYISEELRGSGEKSDHYGLAPSCLALYTLALAGRPEPGYHEVLFKRRQLLSDENRALLALAIVESKGPREMVGQLLTKSAVLTQGNVWFSCQSRQVAMQLLAWCRHDIAAPAIEPLVSDLLGSRQRGHWSTTQGNAWSLLAMTEYFDRIAPTNPAAAGKIEWGTIEKPFALENQAQVFTTALPLGVENASRPLRVSNSSANPLFVRVEVEAYPASFEQAKHDAGYAIERSYARIEDDGQLTDLTDARVGDRVLVTLAIEVRRPAGYLVVDDPLPAIFEPLNPVFKTQETRAQATLGNDWLSDYKELRADRALFFANSIAPGRYIVRYLARVCAAGIATAPSAKVEEMYQPDRFGLSGSVRVSSRSLE